MLPIDSLKHYATQVKRLAGSLSTAEETYYAAIRELLVAILKSQKLPDDVRVNTKEKRGSKGLDRPDVALYDPSGEFPLVCLEVKTPKDDVTTIAKGTGQNDQIGRYLAQTQVVVVTNVRAYALVTAPGWEGDGPPPPEARRVETPVELWPSTTGLLEGEAPASDALVRLTELLTEAVTLFAPLSDPESLARVLAQQARRAKAAMPPDFTDAVSGLQRDFGEALGITFEGEEGEEFFRSSLIQTVFYGMFAGWTLWQKAGAPGAFDWRNVPEYLKIPFLGELFYEINSPTRLKELRIREYLDAASATLGRVDAGRFFGKMKAPTLDGDAEVAAASAITYFYEPFLEAFDPELRKSLGVWYTPPEIVRYQVRKVDRLLRDELGMDLGLADDRVVVLDPCCGTGAYLVEVLQTIATTLREEGVGIEMGARLRHALTQRVIGFEILTAPFVIAHLQLYLLLSDMDAAPGEGERLAVFLTNALTGWESGKDQLKLNFPELQAERDAARKVKQKAEVIVVIGNPPYNRFAGSALKEEGDLVDRYKGIKRDGKGKQVGQSELFTKWGIRKNLLDDLYVRFFRLAEDRIGRRAKFGLVSFISNNRYLSGKSFPIMRESLLHSFSDIWIDNLHGYRQASERTPWDTTCETTFAMEASSGIKVGTAVVTYLKRPEQTTQFAQLHVRDFHGRAMAKRNALLMSIEAANLDTIRLEGDDRVSLDFGIPAYESFASDASKRWKMVPYDATGGYEEWAALDDLFPERYQGVNPNRGIDGSLVDVDRAALALRMTDYYSNLPWAELASRYPELTHDREVGADKKPKFISQEVRNKLLKSSAFEEDAIVEYQNFPLDSRFIYYEQKEKLINRHRPELWENLPGNEFFVLQPEPRRVTAGRPVVISSLFDLHLHEGGSVGIPVFTTPKPVTLTLFDEPAAPVPTANLAPAAWEVLRTAHGLGGDLAGEEARGLVRRLFRAALALGHAPRFESDHRESLAQDWMHLPLPKDAALLAELAEAGDLIAVLLDPLKTARPALQTILGNAYAKLAQVSRIEGVAGQVDYAVTYAYFGGGKGKWNPRSTPPEWHVTGEGVQGESETHPWGDVAGDLYLNQTTFLANIPERVWKYELGGYPVVKKWLGYRQASRRDNKPLSPPELAHLRGIVHRLAALIALHPRLDALYERTIENAFTVEELGLRTTIF